MEYNAIENIEIYWLKGICVLLQSKKKYKKKENSIYEFIKRCISTEYVEERSGAQ